MSSEYYIGTSFSVRVRVREGRLASYINDATVTFGVYDSDGNVIAGSTGSCDYQAESNGLYVGTIPHTIVLTKNQKIEVRVVVTAQDGRVRTKSLFRQAVYG